MRYYRRCSFPARSTVTIHTCAYLVDVLACPCGGRRAIVGDISDREVVVAILAHLGLPTEAPPYARARSPGFDFT